MNQEARKQQELFQKKREDAHVAKKARSFAQLTALKLKQKKEAEAKLKKAEEMKKIEKKEVFTDDRGSEVLRAAEGERGREG